jgi:nucleoid-associated protein YgaU
MTRAVAYGGIGRDRKRRAAMALMDKYSDLFKLANELGLKNPDVKEEAGKLKISGQTEYQLEANRLWDNIKTHQGWENEIVANIKAQRTDVFGVYTVQSGDTLSKIAKNYLGDSNRYMDIFKANSDSLKNPDMIKVGQKLNIPAR